MSTSTLQAHEVTSAAPGQGMQRGFTLRAFVACIFSMLLLGIWVEYAEVYNMTNTMGGPIGENSPPNGAVGVILIIILIGAALFRLRASLRLTTAELIVIYSALIVAAPLMSGGMWHRFFSVTTTITHYQDYRAYEALPGALWPHGPNLVRNGQFRDGLAGFTFDGPAPLEWESVTWRNKEWRCPRMTNPPGDPFARSSLSFSIPRWQGSGKKRREVLTPGEMHLLTLLVKTGDFRDTSSYYVTMQADDGEPAFLFISSQKTDPTFTLQNGFSRRGHNTVTVPRGLRDRLTFTIGLIGPGSLSVHDIEFFNNMAVEGMYQGRNMVRERNAAALSGDERDFLVVKPDNLFSPGGLRYLVSGFIPLRQWAMPALAWTLLIGLLFLGFLCFNVLMRKHWAENEHMPFPMNIFPREFFASEQNAEGHAVLSIFRNKKMWLGFWVLMPLLLLKGLHFYYPDVPFKDWSEIWITPKLSQFVSHRYLVALTERSFVTLPFSLLAITLLVEKNILFSIWFTYALFQFWFLFGRIFNFNRFSGYPWDDQQSIGGFIALGLLAVIAARGHLKQVWLHLWGRLRMNDREELFSYRTAVLLLLLAYGGLIAWGVWMRMGLLSAVAWCGFLLMLGFVASRIRAECGLPYGYWMPSYGLMFLMAAGGFPVFGTTAILIATMCSVLLIQAFFYPIAPIQIEMMELARRFRIRRRDIGLGLLTGLLGGIFIGGFVLLCWGYGFGICMGSDNREQGLVWNSPYNWDWYHKNHFAPRLANMDRIFTGGRMFEPETAPFNVIHNTDAKGVGIGFGVTCLLAWLRSLFFWFPITPLGYVLANTFFAKTNWLTIFVAWAIRSLVLRIGGVHVVRTGLVPFAIGMFLACVVSVIFFDIVGIILRAQGVTTVYSRWP